MLKHWYATDEGPLFYDWVAGCQVRCFKYKGTRYLATSRWSFFWVKSIFQDPK